MPNLFKKTCVGIFTLCAGISMFAANPQMSLLNDAVDVSSDFHDFSNFYYLADRLAEFRTNTSAELRPHRNWFQAN